MVASLAISAMLVTKTLHPPGDATALIAVIGEKIHALGFIYVFVPAGLEAFVLLIIALIVSNLSRNRRYPESWF